MRIRLSRRQKKQLPLMVGSTVLVVGALNFGGHQVIEAMGKPVADAVTGCYSDLPSAQTIVLVDASVPRWNIEQQRSLYTYFDQLYSGLGFNERLSIYTTEGDVVASVPTPRFTLCGGAKTAYDLAQAGLDELSEGYLARQRERRFEKVFAPQMAEILKITPNKEREQKTQSPLLETVRAISYNQPLRAGDHFVLVSDLIQHTESAHFCTRQGDLPSFRRFSKRSRYSVLKPAPFNGASVDALMLVRYGYGQAGYLPYCYSEEELTTFWKEYFQDNGASDFTLTRVR